MTIPVVACAARVHPILCVQQDSVPSITVVRLNATASSAGRMDAGACAERVLRVICVVEDCATARSKVPVREEPRPVVAWLLTHSILQALCGRSLSLSSFGWLRVVFASTLDEMLSDVENVSTGRRNRGDAYTDVRNERID